MFRTARSSFDLDCVNKQKILQQRYDSDEEDVSECEVGQDNSFSPVDFQRCDSADVSTDELSTVDSDGSDFSHLLAVHHDDEPQPSTPDYRGSSRPVSTMTIKQSSEEAGFRPGSCIYRQEGDAMILELPTPDISPHLRTSTYLQPGDYEGSFRSTSPAPSCLSDDDSDVCVAEQVTYMEPSARPNLIQISPTTSEASTRFCPEGNISSITLAEQEGLEDNKSFLSFDNNDDNDEEEEEEEEEKEDNAQGNEEGPVPSATINCLSEVPIVPFPLSPRSQSFSMARPQTAGSEQMSSRPALQHSPSLAMHTRSQSRSIRRPPSLMSVTNFHFPFWPARAASPRVGAAEEDLAKPQQHSRSNSYSPSTNQSLQSRVATPEPLSRDPSFSGSLPSRKPTIKHAAAPSVGSCSTACWSDVDGQANANAAPEKETKKSRTGRKKSLRHGKSDGEKPGKTFLGLRLGKRKSVVKPSS